MDDSLDFAEYLSKSSFENNPPRTQQVESQFTNIDNLVANVLSEEVESDIDEVFEDTQYT